MSFLRIYTRCFSLASDLDDTVEEQLLVGDRPKVCDTPESKLPLKDRLPMRKEEELKEVRLFLPAPCVPPTLTHSLSFSHIPLRVPFIRLMYFGLWFWVLLPS